MFNDVHLIVHHFYLQYLQQEEGNVMITTINVEQPSSVRIKRFNRYITTVLLLPTHKLFTH